MPLRANKNYLYTIGTLLTKLAEYIQQNFTYAKVLRKLMYLWRAVESLWKKIIESGFALRRRIIYRILFVLMLIAMFRILRDLDEYRQRVSFIKRI